MAQTDLVSIGSLEQWLSIESSDPKRDRMLASLIREISRAVLNTLNRPFILPQTVSSLVDGNGQTRLMLEHWPVTSISSVVVDNTVIPASVSGSSGFVFDLPDVEPPGAPQLLKLIGGYRFTKGYNNIQLNYTAGYQVSGELRSVPSGGGVVIPYQPYGVWGSDVSVQYTNGGGQLTMVVGTPSVGQYAISDGQYIFSAADGSRTVSISYGYIPSDLEQAALEWCAYRWAAKSHIGQTSKSVGGNETVSYTNEAVPSFVASTLQNFKRIC